MKKVNKKAEQMWKTKKRAVITVEASMVCSLLCLVLCGMITRTMQLYETVEEFSKTLEEREVKKQGAEWIRLEAFVEELTKEKK